MLPTTPDAAPARPTAPAPLSTTRPAGVRRPPEPHPKGGGAAEEHPGPARPGQGRGEPERKKKGGRPGASRTGPAPPPAQGMRLAAQIDTQCSGPSNGPRRRTSSRHAVANTSDPSSTVHASWLETNDSGVPSTHPDSARPITRLCPT